MKHLIILIMLATLTACVSNKPNSSHDAASWAEIGQTNASRTGVVKRALCVGMEDSRSAGKCPGADVDAKIGMMLAEQMGFDARLLENEAATYKNVLAALNAMVDDVQAGSTLFLFWSGHGGQISDFNGDETDGLDECLYPWDNYLVDDELADIFARVPAGVRVFFICDTCHSSTMARSRLVSPVVVSRSFKASLLLFAGCAEGKVSFGSAMGGYFTTALLDAWREGITYEQWFDAAVKAMPKRPNEIQQPQLTSYGNTSWVNQPALK